MTQHVLNAESDLSLFFFFLNKPTGEDWHADLVIWTPACRVRLDSCSSQDLLRKIFYTMCGVITSHFTDEETRLSLLSLVK